MSADLHLITFDPSVLSIDDVRTYANFNYPSFPDVDAEDFDYAEFEKSIIEYSRLSDIIYNTDNNFSHSFEDSKWIGQVSYLNADVTTEERWVPRSVDALVKMYHAAGGVITITPNIISTFTIAFNLPHDSLYETRWYDGRKSRGVSKARSVKKFLLANIGKPTFVDTW